MYKKHQHAAGLGAAVPIECFIGVRAIGMALVQASRLQTRLHRLAERRAGGQHFGGVGRVVDLVVGPIELGLGEFAPRGRCGDVHGIQVVGQSAAGQRFRGGGSGSGRCQRAARASRFHICQGRSRCWSFISAVALASPSVR